MMEVSNMFIRTMQPQDLSTVVKIYVDTFKATHTGVVSESFLQALSYERARQRFEGIFSKRKYRPFGYVCEDHGTLVGFAVGGLAATPPDGYQGELNIISILPAYHRMGLGSGLLRAVAAHFERERVTSMFLEVFTDNFRARRFYEALGGQKVDERLKEIEREPFMITTYGWSSVHALLYEIDSSSQRSEKRDFEIVMANTNQHIKYKRILDDLCNRFFLHPTGSNVNTLFEMIEIAVRNLIERQGEGPLFPQNNGLSNFEAVSSEANIPTNVNQDQHYILENLSLYLQKARKPGHPFAVRNVVPPPSLLGLAAHVATSLYMPNGVSSDGSGQMLLSETAVSGAIARLAGLNPLVSAGIFTYGGSGTNLYAIKMGLLKALPDHGREGIKNDVVVIASRSSHYSQLTAVNWLGIGQRNYITIPCNPDQTTKLDALEDQCRSIIRSGKRIACIMAVGGSISNMGIDNVADLFEIRQRLMRDFNLDYCPHLHVDSVIGWAYLNFVDYDFDSNPLEFSKDAINQLRHITDRIATLKFADSFGVDFHKTGFTHYNASMIIVKNRDDLIALSREKSSMPPLFQESTYYSPGIFTLETTRPAAAMLAAWLNTQAIGRQGFQVLLGHSIEMGIVIRNLIKKYQYLGLYDVNKHAMGCDIALRCYRPHIDPVTTYEQEMRDNDLLRVNNDYTSQFATWLDRNWTARNDGITLSSNSAAVYTHTGNPMVALRIYPFSPYITEKSATLLVERLADAKREFDNLS
jgi:L-2,4-diaminobutyrate decarboxylase